jgi:hypothetical protein
VPALVVVKSQEVEMATATRPATPFAETRHHFATNAALATLFWLIAATAVATAHARLDALSPSSGAIAAAAVIVVCAFSYTRLCARQAGVTHALAVGLVWLVLGIITEIAMTSLLGRGWYAVLGSPDHPLLRNMFMFAWIFAPALFARRGDNA